MASCLRNEEGRAVNRLPALAGALVLTSWTVYRRRERREGGHRQEVLKLNPHDGIRRSLILSLFTATCLAVTTAAKSGKEAQNTLTPVILLVSALAGTALLPGMRAASPVAAVPFAGQVLVARGRTMLLAGGWAGGFVLAVVALVLGIGEPGVRVCWAFLVGEAAALAAIVLLALRRRRHPAQ